MPEEVLPPGVTPFSFEHIVFVTLTVSIDYMRDAPELWAAGRQSTSDPETSWLYDLTEVSKREAGDLLPAMKIHGVSRKHRQDGKT
jgi:hypothetical protein